VKEEAEEEAEEAEAEKEIMCLLRRPPPTP